MAEDTTQLDDTQHGAPSHPVDHGAADQALVARVQGGDRAAFDLLVL